MATHYNGAGNSHQAVGYDPARQGCRYVIRTGVHCGTQDTATVDGVHGRRRAQHPPRFSRKHARDLAQQHDDHALGAYLRTWIAAELAATTLPAQETAA